VLHKARKRDANAYLHALPADRAAFFARWLARCDRAAPAPPRLTHNDVHGLNIMCGPRGAWLIDWADAAWFDPAYELGSVPMHHVPDVLAGYEERASLGEGAEGRILRAVIGYAARKVVTSDWTAPMDDLLGWLRAGPSARFRDWLPD
jgi:aminoglycoside phosphotransferase (APT) family kinase protein